MAPPRRRNLRPSGAGWAVSHTAGPSAAWDPGALARGLVGFTARRGRTPRAPRQIRPQDLFRCGDLSTRRPRCWAVQVFTFFHFLLLRILECGCFSESLENARSENKA